MDSLFSCSLLTVAEDAVVSQPGWRACHDLRVFVLITNIALLLRGQDVDKRGEAGGGTDRGSQRKEVKMLTD